MFTCLKYPWTLPIYNWGVSHSTGKAFHLFVESFFVWLRICTAINMRQALVITTRLIILVNCSCIYSILWRTSGTMISMPLLWHKELWQILIKTFRKMHESYTKYQSWFPDPTRNWPPSHALSVRRCVLIIMTPCVPRKQERNSATYAISKMQHAGAINRLLDDKLPCRCLCVFFTTPFSHIHLYHISVILRKYNGSMN